MKERFFEYRGLMLLSFWRVALFLFFFVASVPSLQAKDSQGKPPVSSADDSTKLHFEVTSHDPNKSYFGYTLYSYTGDAKVHLLDSVGEIVHTWNTDATRARLLPNCNLLVAHGTDWGKRTEPWKKLRKFVREYSWDGEVVWEYEAPSIAHHDVQRLPSGNTIFPVRVNHRVQVAESNESADPSTSVRRNRSDTVYEITPAGEIAWVWEAHKYLDIHSCGARSCNKPLADKRWIETPRDWTHINTTGVLPENKWFDQGDKRFKPGNVMLMLRNWWQVLLIDRETKKVVWEYAGDYKGGIIAAHEPYMIPKGLPGEGNVLLFDNGGRKRTESYVLEVNPLTKKVVWSYEDPKEFYAAAKGAVQRLPNGNTLISTGAVGRIFEVTPKGEVVWDLRGNRSVNRAKRYGKEFCARLNELTLPAKKAHGAIG